MRSLIGATQRRSVSAHAAARHSAQRAHRRQRRQSRRTRASVATMTSLARQTPPLGTGLRVAMRSLIGVTQRRSASAHAAARRSAPCEPGDRRQGCNEAATCELRAIFVYSACLAVLLILLKA